MAVCEDPRCVSRVGDDLDPDSKVFVLRCSHSMCARCIRRRLREGGGVGRCPACSAAFRKGDARDAEEAELMEMREEARMRKRVRAAMPKGQDDFPGDTESYHEYIEAAEALVSRLMDRRAVEGLKSESTKALEELEALERKADRTAAVARARNREERARRVKGVQDDERRAEDLESAGKALESRRAERQRQKRVRDSLVEGGGPGRLAGVTSATADASSRMLRPALPDVPPPRPLDRSVPQPAGASEPGAAAYRAVECVARACDAAVDRALSGPSLLARPTGRAAATPPPSGRPVASAFGSAAHALSKRKAQGL